MLRFTIRNLLWLMVVVAVACGWLLEWRNSFRQREVIAREHEVRAKKNQRFDMLDKLLSNQGRFLENERKRLGIPPLSPTPFGGQSQVTQETISCP